MQVLRYQLELSQFKQELERRLAEKDEEGEAMRYLNIWISSLPNAYIPSLPCLHRKNHQRQLEALQHTVEEESRGKAEQTRQKKAMEEQLNELQSSIDDAQKVCIHAVCFF